MMKRFFYIFVVCVLIFSSFSYADLMAFQGKALDQGVLVDSGNITVSIYDAASGGTQVYQQSFSGVIQGGFFDVVLGNSTPLNLEYGQNYWVDLSINGNDIDWQGNERKAFESGIGNVDADTLDNQDGVYYLDNTDYCSGGICSGGISAATIDTGQGANELYSMDQDVLTTSSVDFNDIDLGSTEVALTFDNGADMITVHDGFGNFNIKSGVDQDNLITSSSGGSHIRMDEAGYIGLWIDESTLVGGSFSTDSGVTINDGKVSVTGNFDATGEIRQGSGDYGGYEIQTGGQIYSNDYIVAMGGLHVGGTSDPGTDTLVVDGEIQGINSGNYGQLRLVRGNYGVIHRNDDTNYYMLMTNSGNAYGTWNSLRPFTLNLASGNVGIKNAGGGHTLSVGDSISNGDLYIGARDSINGARITMEGSGDYYPTYYFQVWADQPQLVTNFQGDLIFSLINNGAGTASMTLPGFYVDSSVIGIGTSNNLCYANWGGFGACSSSIKFKTNVTNSSLGMDVIDKLRPVEFNWKEEGNFSRDFGFIAEEVEKIDPLLVDYDMTGNLSGVKYDQMSAVLVNAIKEQQEIIDGLKRIVCFDHPDEDICH